MAEDDKLLAQGSAADDGFVDHQVPPAGKESTPEPPKEPELKAEPPAAPAPEQPPSEPETPKEDEETRKNIPGSAKFRQRARQFAAEAAELSRQNDELRKQLASGLAANDPNAKPGIDRAPTEADFPNDFLAYDRARIAWEVRQAMRSEMDRERQRQNASAAEAIRQERLEAYQESVELARSRIPDFDKVLATAKDVWISDPVINEIMNSEKQALLAYHLAQHPEKARELNSMTGVELARAVARLEANVSLPRAKTVTQAPAPPKQVSGVSAPPTSLEDDNISMEDYVRIRAKQEEGRGLNNRK